MPTSPKDNSLHILPCHINYEGEARVEEFFLVSSNHDEESYSDASFRGRRLEGMLQELPKGIQGIILENDMAIDHFEKWVKWFPDEISPADRQDNRIQFGMDLVELYSVLHK